jgi:cyclophilin family peptidyl-prolyl cis-trans isomerase/HEAT repeat protein
VRAAAALGDAGAVPVLSRLVADTSTEATLRLEAMTALGAIAGAESSALLGELMLDVAPGVRGQAARALARVDAEAFTATLSGLDQDRDWTVRAAQAAALGTLEEQRGVTRLESMLADTDQRVVPAVMTALAAAKAPNAERVLAERLTAADVVVRASAAQALAELRATGAVPALQKAYEASAADTTYVARASILSALARIDAATARPLLDAALTDREWAVRVRATELLRQQGVAADAVPSIRPARSSRADSDPEWLALASPRYSPHAFIETDRGIIEIELAVLDAPLTVSSFVSLARKGFFDGLPLHRVVPDFVVQGGDPRGDGEGGPGYTLRDEVNQRPYLRGTVGMALDWKDTGGSQFFITHSPQPHLDGRYTVFGHVVAGLEVLDRIAQWDVIRRVRIWDGVAAQ